MKSNQQLKLEFESGLDRRYRSMRDCFATCVYRTGLERVAGAVDVSRSGLSMMLSGQRNLDPDVIERYMAEFNDATPALYWAARWCQDQTDVQQQALSQLPGLMDEIQKLLAVAGQGGK